MMSTSERPGQSKLGPILTLSLLAMMIPFYPAIEVAANLVPPRPLSEQLTQIQNHIGKLEQNLFETSKNQKNAQVQVKKIQELIRLQKLERELSHERLGELEGTVIELESRRSQLKQKLSQQRQEIKKFLSAIESSGRSMTPAQSPLSLTLQLESPRRRVLARLVDHGLKEIETLQADLEDAVHLEGRIQEETQQLTYLFQDLKEQESVLELNRQMQIDFLKRKKQERMTQLKNYRNLKDSESQVETLIQQFNARRELEQTTEAERLASQTTRRLRDQFQKAGPPLQQKPNEFAYDSSSGEDLEFSKLKGKLSFPVLGGKVLTSFGRFFDSKTGLYIFKKGIDIQTLQATPVRAVGRGKVAFSGHLPNYGQVVIIDHGEHYYSLCAHLGEVMKKTNDPVAAGDQVGLTGGSNAPLYFEIRARNVAVNPIAVGV